jgi:hypothetical protein
MGIGTIITPWTAADAQSPEADLLLAESCPGGRSKIALGSPGKVGTLELSQFIPTGPCAVLEMRCWREHDRSACPLPPVAIGATLGRT